MSSLLKFPVHVEVQIKDNCNIKPELIVSMVTEKLKAQNPVFQNGLLDLNLSEELHEYCDHIKIGWLYMLQNVIVVLLLAIMHNSIVL
jgi:hypothetical protein